MATKNKNYCYSDFINFKDNKPANPEDLWPDRKRRSLPRKPKFIENKIAP